MRELLVLTPADEEKHRPTKKLDKDLNKLESYSSGINFKTTVLEYDNFHEAMEEVFKMENSFIVLGKLTEYGKSRHEENNPIKRRKKKGNPTIEDREGVEIVLDLDDHRIKGFDPLNPEEGIKKFLKKAKIDCDVTWQITSSQKLDSEVARIRLYFQLKTPRSLQDRKAWAQQPRIQADGSVFTCSQPIYTAPPVIEGGKDPIKKRTGFIKRKRRKIDIPLFDAKEKEKYTDDFYRGDSEFDFDSDELPAEFKSGKIYRRYLMPLAFHLANKGISKEKTYKFLYFASMESARHNEFDEENVREFIQDAFEKIGDEKENEGETKSSEDLEKNFVIDVPVFPDDIMNTWPEPWPMIWNQMKDIPIECSPPLLLPTVISLFAYKLNCRFVTKNGRRPNMLFLNLTPSTGNKDVNSRNVIDDLDLLFKKRKGKKGLGASITPFSNIMSTNSTITSDSSFLQSFDANENFFWLNTEATRIFQQLGTSNNSNVAALSDKFIEVVDGKDIKGKRKSGESFEIIRDPNCQILLYAQPETIEQHITLDTIDSGLFGRTIVSIVPDLDFDLDEFSFFPEKTVHDKKIDEVFHAFMRSNVFFQQKVEESDKIIAAINPDHLAFLNKELKKEFGTKLQEDAYQKVLKRLGITMEQLYTVIYGVAYCWAEYNSEQPPEYVDGKCILDLIKYWGQAKVYTIDHHVNVELDPLSTALYEILKEFLRGRHDKELGRRDFKILKQDNFVSVNKIFRVLRWRNKLIRKLSKKSGGNHEQNALRLMEQMVKYNMLKKKEYPYGTYFALSKDA